MIISLQNSNCFRQVKFPDIYSLSTQELVSDTSNYP